MNPYRRIFQSLSDAGVCYLVVGGVAVNLHGYSRFTADVDVLLALEEENLARVKEIMRKMKYTERLPVELTALAKKDQVRQWMEEKNMTAFTFVSPQYPQFSLDVLAGASLRFEEFHGRKQVISAWGIAIPVIALEDLIAMKREAGRPQDGQDIEALLTLRER